MRDGGVVNVHGGCSVGLLLFRETSLVHRVLRWSSTARLDARWDIWGLRQPGKELRLVAEDVVEEHRAERVPDSTDRPLHAV